ncbi:MAG: MBL fold metallo-hydrolase [Clostridia bacterium]|nr:MBL fold metallo-hydrolase [Clostridia bacterium]
MLENISINCHSSIKFSKDKILYFDPFRIKEEIHDADIIFCTHTHYDHLSEEDIIKIKKDITKIVVPVDGKEKLITSGFDEKNIITVNPDKEYEIDNIKFKTVRAYNENKKFHPKENNWVGYIVYLKNVKYYIAGDTDITKDNRGVRCDVAFLPIGGTYTMTATEAASLANEIKPKIAVPIHYGEIVGEKEDVIEFKNILNSNIECIELI